MKKKFLLIALMLLLFGSCTSEKIRQCDVIHPPSIADVVGYVDASVVLVKAKQESGRVFKGSGFMIRGNKVVTAAHVLGNAVSATIVTTTGKEYQVKTIHVSKEIDCGVLILDVSQKLPFSYLGNSDRLRKGQRVFLIGSPNGRFNSVSAGVISGLDRLALPLGDELLIQTDAASNPGNSGGPLYDLYGRVVGVLLGSNPHGENLSYCLPINLVKDYLEII